MRPIDTAFTVLVYPLGSLIASWLVATGSPNDAAGVAIVCLALLLAMACGAAWRMALTAHETRVLVRRVWTKGE